jgi:hypothetical protein
MSVGVMKDEKLSKAEGSTRLASKTPRSKKNDHSQKTFSESGQDHSVTETNQDNTACIPRHLWE